MARRLTWLDVFTATPMTGNGLAVVHEADDVDDATMHAFARETNLSETTFVQTATEEGADYRNRIWMPGEELDFAGHPSLGTAVAVARARGELEARYVQQTRAGLQPVEVHFEGDVARASMLQNPATFGEELDVADVLRAVGLDGDLGDPEVPCQAVSTGQHQIIAPIRDAGALARVAPDPGALAELFAATGAITLYLAVREEGSARVCARSFFLQDGAVREDPATGSAAGPLMAHLHARTGATSAAVDQGVEMGRPSRLDCSVEGDRVRVGGDVVILAEGEVAI